MASGLRGCRNPVAWLPCVDFCIIKSMKGKMMQAIHKVAQPIPSSLAAVAQGRDYIKTEEFAHAWNCAVATVHKNHCLKGECYGVRPIKRGKLLLWPVAGIAQAMIGGV